VVNKATHRGGSGKEEKGKPEGTDKLEERGSQRRLSLGGRRRILPENTQDKSYPMKTGKKSGQGNGGQQR